MNLIIKIVLAALLIGCLFNMPYGYFQFTRLAACVGFIVLMVNDRENDKYGLSTLLVIGVILFQPIWKVSYTRLTWNIIDAVIAALLIVWAIMEIRIRQKVKN